MKILDRLLLNSVLPSQGNFVTMATASDIREKLKMDAEEREKVGLKDTNDGRVALDAEKDTDKEIEFSQGERALIRKSLSDMETKQHLTVELLSLYREFVVGDNSNGE